MEKAPIINISNYKKIKLIGRGAYGHVDLVEDIKTGQKYAMKYIKQNQKHISSEEIDSYIKTDYPTIIKFYGYNNISNPKSLALLLEYMPNGSLENVLKKSKSQDNPINFTGTKKYIILKGIAYGMKYLHSRSIIHRDLKTDNILLDKNFYPKICDFGISYVSDLPCSTVRMDKFIGTPLYKSPEILNEQSYSYKIDIYSYSMIAYELITGKTPFYGYTPNKIYENVKQGIRPNISKLPSFIQNFFNKCWSDDPMKRATFDDIINMISSKQFQNFFNADEAEVFVYESLFNDLSKVDEFIEKIDIDKAIEEGNSFYIYLYGLIHNFRFPKYYDRNKALKYIKIAADKGCVDAMYKYVCILSEEKNEENQSIIIKYLKMASEKGNVDAMFYYSFRLLTGNGIRKNKEEGVNYMKKAADLGHKNSIFSYGFLSFEGELIDKNLEEAAKYLKKSADLFNSNAMFLYGKMLIDGEGIPINVEDGLNYIKRAADQGDVNSMFSYAYYLFDGKIVQTNKIEAARYFKMGANQGDEDSAYFYARMLYHGNGIPQDKKEAQKYFKIGGKNGSLISMYSYAVNKLMGLDGSDDITINDKKEGFHYIKKLIDLEFTQAITFFWFYTSIYEVIKDFNKFHDKQNPIFGDYIPMSEKELAQYKQKALNFFERECEKGNEYILLFYVDVLSSGLPGPSNPYKEIKYLEKLVSMGNVKAMNMLGNKYLVGNDVNKNICKAYSLFKMSAKKGSETGIQTVNWMLRDKDIFYQLLYAGYATFDDLKKIEDEGYSDFLAVYNSTAEIARRLSVETDFNDPLDSFCKGIGFSYNEYEPNSDEINFLSVLKYQAKEGDANSLYNYGIYILDFKDSIESKAKAIEYIKEAADKGHVEANYKYGKLLLKGIVTNESRMNAIDYFKFAADHKEKKSMFYYGKILYEEDCLSDEAQTFISYIKESADLGYIKAMSYYGLLILDGKISGKDKTEAVKYLQESADLENPVSMLYYGNMLLKGELVKKDTKKGIEFIKKSADLGNSDALFKYGLILYEGIEVTQNKEEASFYFKKSADKGNKEAILKYGEMLMNGDGIEIDKKEASIYLKMLADQGNETAMCEYGMMMTEKDKFGINKKALEYIEDSASLGNPRAMVELGIKFYDEYENVENLVKAAELFKKAADLGDSEGMFSYGHVLISGIGVPSDMKEGLKYLKKSAELKNELGMLTYARVLKEIGNSEKIQEALKYYKILLEMNNSEALYDYAIFLYEGVVVPRNLNESARLFKKSADLGNPNAMAYYGEMLFYGKGIKSDIDESIKYLKKSIELDNILGMQIYGQILLSSNDIEKLKEAEKLFKILIQRGDAIVKNENGIGNIHKGKHELHIYGNALSLYAGMLYYGIGVQTNKNEAIKLFKKSIELNNQQGIFSYATILLENDDAQSKLKAAEYFKQIKDINSDAMFEYGMMLLTGNGIPINKQEAVECIRKAVEHENPRAIFQYGRMLLEGNEVPCNKELAIEYYKKAGDLGNNHAMFIYAMNLIQQNEKEGLMYLKKSADLGNPNAMAMYGMILNRKNESPSNKKVAIEYLKKSSDLQCQLGMLNYADILSENDDFECNRKAAELYKKIIDDGTDPRFNANAMLNYGYLLELGKGVPKNLKEAAFYYKQSANLGCPDAMACYGEMLYYGKGVKVDKNESIKYLLKSIELKSMKGMIVYLKIQQENKT